MLFSTRRFFLRKPCLVVLLLVLLLFYKVNSIDIYPREITYVDSISLNYKSNFIEGIKSSSDLKRLVDNFFQKGEKTLLLTVINKNNQRRYLGVKIN